MRLKHHHFISKIGDNFNLYFEFDHIVHTPSCPFLTIAHAILYMRVTDHPQSGWLGFFRHRRKKTKAR